MNDSSTPGVRTLYLAAAAATLLAAAAAAYFGAPGAAAVFAFGALAALAFFLLARASGRAEAAESPDAPHISETRARTVVEQSPLSTQIFSPDGRTVRVNRAWEELWGVTLEQLGDYNVLEDPQLVEKGIMPFIRKAFEGEATHVPPVLYDPDQTIPGLTRYPDPLRWVQAFIYPVKDERGRVREVVLVHEDITERVRAEQRLSIQHEVTRALAESGTLSEAAPKILTVVGENLGWGVGALWAADSREPGQLRCVELWHAPRFEAPEFESLSRRLRFARGEGLPGRVWAAGEPVWVTDLDDANMPRAPAARRHGLRSAFAFPVLLGGEVLAVLEFFGTRKSPPDEGLLALMSAVGSQVGQFVERKRAERTLRESEEHYRSVTETASDAIITIDEESIIVFVNAAAGRVFGYGANELLGRSLTVLMPETFRAAHRGGVRRYLDTNERHISWRGVELPGRRKDGSEVPLEISFGEFTKDGRRFFTGVVRDITRRKLAARALEESEQKMRLFVEYAPAAIAMFDREMRYVAVSRRWLVDNRLDGQEVIGRSHYEVSPNLPEHWKEGHRRALAGAVERAEEERYVRPDGTADWLRWEVRPWQNAQGEIAGVIIFTEIITGRKRAEAEREALLAREREARRQAEEANRLKDEFLATLSHELRTPLTSILGWSRLLNTGLDERMRGRAAETIERNARAQAQLIDDLLDVSRIITGKLRLNTRPVELAPVIEAAADAVRPAAAAKGVTLRVLLDPPAGPVPGDPDRLQQVFWNLFSNAIKFTPAGGRVEARLTHAGGHAEVTVTDTGEGIAPEFLPHVFERFRQADGAITRRHGGLGLGLAIVRHLVELHGGTVRVESEGEGRGATFALRLPLLAPAAPAPGSAGGGRKQSSALPGDCASLAGLRVLVVDDDADTRTLLRALLERCGAAVALAASAAEALEHLRRAEAALPDVLVSDIGMPHEDGYQLIRRVRALPAERGGQIPAAALTAYARVEDRARALAEGYQAHVSKPVDPAELTAVIADLAARGVNV